MTGFNKVILMGHLTRDPELKTLPSGTPVCEIGLAVNRRWKTDRGEQREEVLFVDCTAFGKRAEALAKYFKKGSPIQTEGYLKLDRWEAQDGTARSKIKIIVEGFGFLGNSEAKAPATTPKQKGRPATGKRPAPRKQQAALPEMPAEIATADIPF
ncbi:MAG TPA: single-stranded DNA-binding protein [Phycisphaerae bacterium]